MTTMLCQGNRLCLFLRSKTAHSFFLLTTIMPIPDLPVQPQFLIGTTTNISISASVLQPADHALVFGQHLNRLQGTTDVATQPKLMHQDQQACFYTLYTVPLWGTSIYACPSEWNAICLRTNTLKHKNGSKLLILAQHLMSVNFVVSADLWNASSSIV